MSVFQDSNRQRWISADTEGLYELGIDGRRLRHDHPDYSENSVPNVVMCIYEDTDYNLWIGSYGQGLAKLDKATGKCEHFQQINNPIVYSIAEDKKKNLFFGVFGSGFYQYNLQSRKLEHYESSKD